MKGRARRSPSRFWAWLLAGALAVLVGGSLAAVFMRGHRPGSPAVPFREEQVTFDGAGNSLAGVLVLPGTPGPHPAVVFLNGSDGADRTGRGRWPQLWRHFAARGFASLSWDRPGVGGSTGDFEKQTFADRAEALAAVRFLRARPDVRADAVVLWGFSQGGAVAPLAASRSPEVAFLIVAGGSQVPAGQQDAHRVESELRAPGFVLEAPELVADWLAERFGPRD